MDEKGTFRAKEWKGRFVLEGTWSGYSSNPRVVHREVVYNKRAWRLSTLHAIQYTDGTTLNLSLRPAQHLERVEQIFGYSKLIRDAERIEGSFIRVADMDDCRPIKAEGESK